MKIIKFILFLLIPILIADQLISRVMEKVYEKTYTGQTGGSINYLLHEYDHISLLTLGNSRCAHHVIPELLNPDAFNLSHNGMSLVFQTGLADQLIRNEKITLDTLMIHLERDEILGQNKSLEKDIQHLKYYYQKNDWIRNRINNLSYFEPVKFSFASYKWNGKVMNIINNRIKSDLKEIPSRGYVSIPPSKRDSVNVVWSYDHRLKTTVPLQSDSVISNLKVHVSHLKRLCDAHNVTLILFTSPVYHPDENTKQSDALIIDFFKNAGVPYLDYYNSLADDKRFSTYHLWRDAHHLNHEGAKIFTEIIRTDLNTLNLIHEY